MARTGSGKPDEVLDGVVRRLIEQLPAANETTCYAVTERNADRLHTNPGEFVFQVCLLSGTFDEGYFDGGGLEQLLLVGGLSVKVLSPNALDLPGHDGTLLIETPTSIIDQWLAVIKAVADPAWSPTRDGDEILRDPMIPRAYKIDRTENGLIASIEQDFSLSMDLDVS